MITILLVILALDAGWRGSGVAASSKLGVCPSGRLVHRVVGFARSAPHRTDLVNGRIETQPVDESNDAVGQRRHRMTPAHAPSRILLVEDDPGRTRADGGMARWRRL